MGCVAPSQRRLAPTRPIDVLPNLLSVRETETNRESGTVAKVQRRGSAVVAGLDECGGPGQISAAEKGDILMLVAEEADDLDRAETPMIALVSHDNMKPLMASFMKCYTELLRDFRLTGTGTTCKVLKAMGLEPEDRDVPSGPLGGDQMLGGMISTGEIRALIFFQDPLSAHAHADDIGALSRLCNVYQIYFATNYRSAGAILEHMHCNLKRAGTRATTLLPADMTTDLGTKVQENYKKTRQLAVAAAV